MPQLSGIVSKLTGRQPHDLPRRGLIALVSALAILLIIDRIVAFSVDTATMNAFLPDVEILLFCVIVWVVFTYMATTKFWKRKSKAEPPARPPKRRQERQPEKHTREYYPPPKGSVLHTPRATSKGPWRSSLEMEVEQPAAPQRMMSLARWVEELEKIAATKDPEETEALLRKMRKTGAVPGTGAYNAVIRSCTGAGSMPRAEKWQEYMSLVGVDADVATYRILIDGYIEAGDMVAAESCVPRMREAGLEPDAECYAAIVQAHVSANSKAVAGKWLEEMVERGLKPTAVPYSLLVELLGQRCVRPEWGAGAS